MDAVTSLPISSAIDETMRQLDELNRPRRMFEARVREDFRALVAAVPVVESSDSETPPSSRSRGREDGSARVTGPDPLPFVAIPRGDFGPAVREKLRAEALAKRGW